MNPLMLFFVSLSPTHSLRCPTVGYVPSSVSNLNSLLFILELSKNRLSYQMNVLHHHHLQIPLLNIFILLMKKKMLLYNYLEMIFHHRVILNRHQHKHDGQVQKIVQFIIQKIDIYVQSMIFLLMIHRSVSIDHRHYILIQIRIFFK